MKYVTNTCPACGGNFEFLESEIEREWNCPHCSFPVLLQPGLPSSTILAPATVSAICEDSTDIGSTRSSTQTPLPDVGRRIDSPHPNQAEAPGYPSTNGERLESELKSGSGSAFRWILVLPAATAGFLLGSIIFNPFLNPYAELLPGLLRSTLTSCIQGAFFVIAGTQAAPSHRFITALSLTVLHAMFLTAMGSYYVFAQRVAMPLWGAIVAIAPAIITTICVCAALRKDEESVRG
jgi:DNA-directed RNA polymerase subunit RPC12/RpoP